MERFLTDGHSSKLSCKTAFEALSKFFICELNDLGVYVLEKEDSRYGAEILFVNVRTVTYSWSRMQILNGRDSRSLQHHLKGNTMSVYLYLLKHERAGVREIARAINLSSATLAQYHLRKLEGLGIAKSDNGEYSINKEVAVDALQSFAKLGTHMIPRFMFYAVSFSVFVGFLLFKAFTNALTSLIYWMHSAHCWFLQLLSSGMKLSQRGNIFHECCGARLPRRRNGAQRYSF
jgi:hypothetical protein